MHLVASTSCLCASTCAWPGFLSLLLGDYHNRRCARFRSTRPFLCACYVGPRRGQFTDSRSVAVSTDDYGRSADLSTIFRFWLFFDLPHSCLGAPLCHATHPIRHTTQIVIQFICLYMTRFTLKLNAAAY